MKSKAQHRTSSRLLVVMPSWIGDAVMATPCLRALRQLYPEAHVTALARQSVRPVLDACPWIDRVATMRSKAKDGTSRTGTFTLARRLAAAKFDTAVLLPNSFRSALIVMLAGVPRRVGYDRDGRGFLLTDRLVPRRQLGSFVPVPTRDYYLGLARYLGAREVDPGMQLFTRPEHDQEADRLLTQAGRKTDQPFVVITPGASFGSAKMWPPDRFAAVADQCVDQLGALVAVAGAPRERPVLDRVVSAARRPVLDLARMSVDLALFKSVMRRTSLVITNDTGPRHIAAAMNVPVVTLFGPTDPAWTEIGFTLERQIMVSVECGPCQLKRCPLDHRCMTQIHAPTVLERAAELLGRARASA